MRITAILALHELGADENDSRLLRHYVYAWLREVMRLGEERHDIYFATHRRNDERTHPPNRRGRDDPYTREAVLLLCEPAGSGLQLRPVFRAHYDEIVPLVVRWLLRRYEFQLAVALTGWAPITSTRLFLTLQRMMLRLGAATGVGCFATTSQSDVWNFMLWLGGQGYWLGLYVAALLVLVAGLVWREVLKRAPLRYSPRGYLPSLVRVLGIGVTYAFSLSVLITGFANQAIRAGADEHRLRLLASTTCLGPPIAEAATALFFGFLLQLLWEDKAISEEI